MIRTGTLLLASTTLGLGTTAAMAQSTQTAEARTSGQRTPDERAEVEAEVEDATIVVTGFRAASRAAIDAKRKSNVILDAISQDDIGDLPDLNIVESARRITGLSTVGGLDPTKNRDIYQRVTIRGLDPRYNLITVDGVPLASSEWTVRGARLEQFPNSLVARIEAIKTITSEYDPHGLGGQLNIVSRSALDGKAPVFAALNASVGLNSTSGTFLSSRQPNFRADGTAAFKLGSDERIGVIVSAEFQRLRSAAFSELPGDTNGNGWTYYTPAGGQTPFVQNSRDGILVAVRPQDFRFDNERTRASVNAKIEYDLIGGHRLSAFGGYYYDKDEEYRAEVLTVPGGAPTNVTATSGSFATGNLQQGIVLQPQTRETYLGTLRGQFELTDRLKLVTIASYSQAGYDEQRIFHKWATAVAPGRATSVNTPNFGFRYNIADGRPVATHNARDLGLDPSAYVNLYIRDIFRVSRSNVHFGDARLSYNDASDDRGLGLRLGVTHTRTNQSFDVQYLQLTPANANAQAQVGGLRNFLFTQQFPSLNHAVIPYLLIDPARVTAFVAANPSLFLTSDQGANNFGDDFRDVEKVNAGYAQLAFQTDDIRLVAGVRYDATNVRADTFRVPTVAGSTAFEPISRTSSYEFWLPSALLTWRPREDIRITTGVSKTIGRPDFSQYAARTSFSIGTIPGVLTINTGNPALRPREALNYDLSLEWYLPNAGLASVAFFHKDIRNEIFTGNSQGEPTTFRGVTYTDVTITQPLNSGRASITGIEANYVQDSLPFLPEALSGVGLSLNATYLKGSFDLPRSAAARALGLSAIRKTSGLLEQPDYIVNATLFYADGPFEARVAVNRIGRALQRANLDTQERDLIQEARSQVDLALRYSLKSNFDVQLRAQNVTRDPFVVRQGPGREFLNNRFTVGSAYWVGVSWRPGR
ncbi:TonB-dependent receptor [Sphingomonas sp. 37zxx]|uniref:TonB-dependent receptor n=1 Tax=Sphingomonas sp. 37zxx TaxID=1550073 RepID=UPI00053BFEDA|nr:TonB-dependent receptor [Sphingomonas sp. 37zxx]